MESIKPGSFLQPELVTSSNGERLAQKESLEVDKDEMKNTDIQNQAAYYDTIFNFPPPEKMDHLKEELTSSIDGAVYELVDTKNQSDATAKDKGKGGYDVPSFQGDYDDLTDEQIEQVYQTLNKIISQRKGSTEKMRRDCAEHAHEHKDEGIGQQKKKPQPRPRKPRNQICKEVGTSKQPPAESNQDLDQNSNNQDGASSTIPPPLPPKKRKFKLKADFTHSGEF